MPVFVPVICLKKNMAPKELPADEKEHILEFNDVQDIASTDERFCPQITKKKYEKTVPSLRTNISKYRAGKCLRSKSLDLSICDLTSVSNDWLRNYITNEQLISKQCRPTIATLKELTTLELSKVGDIWRENRVKSFLEKTETKIALIQLNTEKTFDILDAVGDENILEGEDDVFNCTDEVLESKDDSTSWDPWNGTTVQLPLSSNPKNSPFNKCHRPSYQCLLVTKGNGFASNKNNFDSFFAETKGFLGHTGNSCLCRGESVKKPLYQR